MQERQQIKPSRSAVSNGTLRHNASKQDNKNSTRNPLSEPVTIKTQQQNKRPRKLPSEPVLPSGESVHDKNKSLGNPATGQEGQQSKGAEAETLGGSGPGPTRSESTQEENQPRGQQSKETKKQTLGGSGSGPTRGASTQEDSEPLVHLTLPLPLNGCTSSQDPECAHRLEVTYSR